MKCAWNELLAVLPPWLRQEMNTQDGQSVQELRLRIKAPPELVMEGQNRRISRMVSAEDLNFCINTASRYSPWAASSVSSGYITSPGGHRIGICGETVCKDGQVTGFHHVSSLCIRVARDFPGLAASLSALHGSLLILGAPGWGKTTLLRDLIRQRSDRGEHIAVVDQRGELFPGEHFSSGSRTDILTGCSKSQGTEMLLRTMGPQCIAMDEITAQEDCQALIQAAWCGVSLLATAHASSLEDFQSRQIYSPLVNSRIFDHFIILHPNKSWHLERSVG